MERAGDDEFCTKLNLKDFYQGMVPSAGRSVDSPTEGRRRLIHVGAYIYPTLLSVLIRQKRYL